LVFGEKLINAHATGHKCLLIDLNSADRVGEAAVGWALWRIEESFDGRDQEVTGAKGRSKKSAETEVRAVSPTGQIQDKLHDFPASEDFAPFEGCRRKVRHGIGSHMRDVEEFRLVEYPGVLLSNFN